MHQYIAKRSGQKIQHGSVPLETQLFLVVILPALLLTHGISSVLGWGIGTEVVYAIKIATGISVFITVGRNWQVLIQRLGRENTLLPVGIIFIASSVTPIVIKSKLDVYYISDGCGMLVTYLAYLSTCVLIEKGALSLEGIANVLWRGTISVSAVIIAIYLLSGGAKVSIPPEIHYSLGLVAVLISSRSSAANSGKLPGLILIAAAVFASQLRTNMVIPFIGIIFGLVWRVAAEKWDLSEIKKIIPVILISMVALLFSDIVRERLESFELSSGSSRNDFEFSDASANQRLTEAELVLDDLAGSHALLYLIGKGFGATYYNGLGVIAHYQADQHHAHMTPVVVLLRHGVLGLIAYLTLPILGVCTLFTRNHSLFAASASLLLLYLALMADQYIYWSLTFGIAVASWRVAWRQARARGSWQ